MHLYINGKQVGTRRSKFDQTRPGGRIPLGCVLGDPDNIDAALRNTAYFCGMIDGAWVYNRPLTERQIIATTTKMRSGRDVRPLT